jgi:lipopolysaccharide assembly outer membrane protein LptD (OstA)
MKRKLLLYCLFSLLVPVLYGQQAPGEENQAPESGLSAPERQRIEMEIRSSTLPELASWCRSLGLSESGTRGELTRRIRRHFNLGEGESQDDSRKIITIESAQASDYFTIDVIDEDYARLRGDVRLSMIDGDDTHRISADEILFNRTRNILTARGNVMYVKESGDSIETFHGESITVNIDDWSSVFLDGYSRRGVENGETAYIFSGTVISRTSEDTTVLNNAVITSANEEALWSVSASKIWLLPGSDFAILNAVLKIGEIPVLYIPFFFYPVDELIFHPVIGYRSREGGFIQTTTYLWGRPKVNPSETSSLARILGNSSNTEKERHGIFLRGTGKKIIDPDKFSLKVLLDYYINLGTYIGADLYTPKWRIINPVELSLGIGFSRTITQDGGYFTPYDASGGFSDNRSNLFSMSVPFRYRFDFNSSLSGTYGSLSWNFPFYSDPFMESDFLNRSESMDWLNLMQQGLTDEASADSSIRTTYQWHLNGIINPSVSFFNPYLTRLSISNISMTMAFKMIEDRTGAISIYAPERYFYAPDKYTIYNISASIGGTPLSIDGFGSKIRSQAAPETDDPFGGIGVPISPWREEDKAQEVFSDELLVPPAINTSFSLPGLGNIRFNIDYNLYPTSSSELQFITENWTSYKDIDWSDVQSVLTSVSGRGDINLRMNHSEGLFTNTFTFSGRGTWRDYSYLNEEAYTDNAKVTAARRQLYSQTNYSTSYAYNGTLRPLYRDSVFNQTVIQYGFNGTLLRSARYVNGNGPEITPQWGQWVKEKASQDIYGLTFHRLTTTLSASLFDRQQILSFGADLPPLDPLYLANATFRIWYSETNVNFRIRKPEETGVWTFEPIFFTETLRFPLPGEFIYYMVIKPEENYDITTITSSLSLLGLRASFTAEKTVKYRFIQDSVTGGKWEEYGQPVLTPGEFSLRYNNTFSEIEILKNRIDFSVKLDTSLRFDLLRHTNSSFQFELGFNFNIAGILRVEFSATAENNVIWRYFKGISAMDSLTYMYPEGPQNNVFFDLIDSFNFMNDSARRRSGFKMRRFDLKLIHFLGDWSAEFSVNMYPFLNEISGRTPRYEITTDFTFLVQWKPITEIKTNISREGRYDRWTRN